MTTRDEFDDLERRVLANISQAEANWAIVEANLAMIKPAGWRLFRNRRLLDRNWQLLRANNRLAMENNLMLMRRWEILRAG